MISRKVRIKITRRETMKTRIWARSKRKKMTKMLKTKTRRKKKKSMKAGRSLWTVILTLSRRSPKRRKTQKKGKTKKTRSKDPTPTTTPKIKI